MSWSPSDAGLTRRDRLPRGARRIAPARLGADGWIRHHANVVLEIRRDFGGFRENRPLGSARREQFISFLPCSKDRPLSLPLEGDSTRQG